MKKFNVRSVIILIIVCLFFVGCLEESESTKQRKAKKKNVAALVNKQKAPLLPFSMDRFLLSERLLRFNDPNKMSYLYVFAPAGHVFQFTIVGKIASTSKRLNTTIDGYGNPSPDDMGVYGESSGGAKVGMSTVGSLVEFGGFGFFIYSETPLAFSGMKDTVIEIKVETNSDELAGLKSRIATAKSMSAEAEAYLKQLKEQSENAQ